MKKQEVDNMKIDNSLFIDLLNKASPLQKCVLNFNDKGIEILGFSPDNIVCAHLILKKSKIVDNFKDVKIGIDNIDDFINKISRLSGNLNFDIRENKYLNINSANKTLNIVLPDISLFENIEPGKIEQLKEKTNANFNLSVESIKEIIKDSSVLKSNDIAFTINQNKLVLKTESETEKFEITCPLVNNFENVNVIFNNEILDKVFKNIDDGAKIYLKSNFPMVIEQENESFMVKYAIAPKVVE
jgi:hypothetical protein